MPTRLVTFLCILYSLIFIWTGTAISIVWAYNSEEVVLLEERFPSPRSTLIIVAMHFSISYPPPSLQSHLSLTNKKKCLKGYRMTTIISPYMKHKFSVHWLTIYHPLWNNLGNLPFPEFHKFYYFYFLTLWHKKDSLNLTSFRHLKSTTHMCPS